jgi:uncharacterized protein
MSSGPERGTAARLRVVFDTNILLSAAIYSDSPSARTYRMAVEFCDLYRSADTFAELSQVLLRSKFDRYFSPDGSTRGDFLDAYESVSTMIVPTHLATECIDPKDNKFLSLAVSVQADVLASGDRKHLLPMNPYNGVQILTELELEQLIVKKT